MDPIWKSDASSLAWAARTSRSIGYPHAGDLATGRHPTHVGGEWFEDLLQEIKNVIEEAGLPFDPSDVTQFFTAIKVLMLRPDFVASPTHGTEPLTVSFRDTTTRGVPTSHFWDFGDGQTSTAAAPTHTYQAAGTYTVSMTVTIEGALRTVTKPALISVAAPPDDSTVFLLHFEGTPGTQTFVDSGILGLTFTPADGGVTLVADPRVGSTSARFANSNGISTPWPGSFSMAGEFTIEFSWKPTDLSVKQILVSSASGGLAGDHMMIVLFDGGHLQWYQGAYGQSDTRAAFPDLAIVANEWNDIAITRDRYGIVRAYLGGVCSTTTYVDTTDYTHTGHVITVGGLNAPGSSPATYELDEVRLASICLYTANYPVSLPLGEAPGRARDPYFSSVTLLVNGDTLTDPCGHVLQQIGAGSVAPVFTDADFPSGALQVGPGSGALHIAAIGTELVADVNGDFTLEFDYKATAKNAPYPCVMQMGGANDLSYLDNHDFIGAQAAWELAGAFPDWPVASPVGTKNVVALVRKAGLLSYYRNGTLIGSITSANAYGASSSVGIGCIAAGYDSSDVMTGLIGRIRFTKGVARYSGSSYTPNPDLWPTS
jgi:PKD repeat protein